MFRGPLGRVPLIAIDQIVVATTCTSKTHHAECCSSPGNSCHCPEGKPVAIHSLKTRNLDVLMNGSIALAQPTVFEVQESTPIDRA